jgi:SAM-dependent methyltransferase
MDIESGLSADEVASTHRRAGRGVASVVRRPLALLVSAAERLRLWLLTQRWFASVLLPALPRRLRWFMRKAYFAPIDIADRLLARRMTEVPSKAGTFTGAVQDFVASGEAFVDALRAVAGMTTSSHVLDVGCGVGRLALPASRFLAADGGYEGLDIVPEGIAWCQQHIADLHDNVHFTLADIYNKEYNPKGHLQAADYRFPYESDTFDVVVLASVFTHMLPVEVEHYIGEIARVLKKDGRLFATYFLITQESLRLMDSSASPMKMKFKHNQGPCWFVSAKIPELAVAYDEDYIRAVYAKHGLSGEPDLYVGAWRGGPGHWPPISSIGYQDTLVATKL